MPRISDEVINNIRSKADIVEIISEYLPLTSHGKNYFGVCPFHQDTNPSMSVSREKQIFKCFSCGHSGNVFTFVSDYENISFIEAVQKVGAKVGINIDIGNIGKNDKATTKEHDILASSKLYFQNNIMTSLGITAKKYLYDRGLSDEDIKEFNIGLALDNNSLLKYLKQKQIPMEEAEKLGLISKKENNFYDMFVNRIMFPIEDDIGRCIGFTGRIYKDTNGPKYLNTKETSIFKKGTIFFNYHRAKDSVRLKKEIIVVEGNMDAIRMYTSGFKNTIALMGVSLTKEQINLLKHLRSEIILMLDNDNAGLIGTLNVGKELMDNGFNVSVIRLDGEKDPDSYILKNGIKAMEDNISNRVSFLEFRYYALQTDKNLKDAKDLSIYVKEVLDGIKNADKITKDIFIKRLVNDFDLSYEILDDEIQTEEKVLPKEIQNKKVKINKYDKASTYLLYYMMNDIKYVNLYQKKLGFFKEENYREIANLILYYVSKNKSINIADFLTFIQDNELRNNIYNIVNQCNFIDLEIDVAEELVKYIKQMTLENEIKNLKGQLKNTNDISTKEKIGQQIVNLRRKIEESNKERSENND